MDRRIKQESHDAAQTSIIPANQTIPTKRSRTESDQQSSSEDPELQIDMLQKKLDAEQNLCKQLQEKLVKKDERINYYLKLNEQAAKTSTTFSKLLHLAEARNKADLARIETTEKVNREQKEANELVVAQLKKLETQNNELNVKLSDAQELFDKKLSQQKVNFEKFQEDTNQLMDKAMKRLQEQNNDLQTELSNARKTNDDVACQNNELKKQNQELLDINKMYELAREQIKDLEVQKKSLRAELDKIQSEKEAATNQQLSELKARNCELVNKVKELEGIRKTERDSDALLIKSLISQKETLALELTKFAVVQYSMKMAEQQIADLKAQNQDLVTRFGALNHNFKVTVQELSNNSQRKQAEANKLITNLQKEKDDACLALQKERENFKLQSQKCAKAQEQYKSIAVAHIKKLGNLHKRNVAIILKLEARIDDQKSKQLNKVTRISELEGDGNALKSAVSQLTEC